MPARKDSIALFTAATDTDLMAARELFSEYAQLPNVDLCFQNFEAELTGLPGDYSPPRGAIYLATSDGILAGCCALRPLGTLDYPNACEIKRLYVRSRFRRLGLGRQLVEAILDSARQAGFAYILLETLGDMKSARALYKAMGFDEIAAYHFNSISGAHYLKAILK
jgi:ribosomal protein S18 acetylase RimI-like enzyme